MRKPILLLALVTPLFLAACLGLPEKSAEKAPDAPAGSVTPDTTAEVEDGMETPVETIVTAPAETVNEDDGAAETLAGCPEIADTEISLENPIAKDTADLLVGLTEKVATACAESKGWVVRVVAKDGEEFMLTADYLANRVGLTVENDVVTAVIVG